MKILLIGGTGLLGSEGAAEMIRRGHEVCALALPPLPRGAVLPPQMRVEFGNYLTLSDEELRRHFAGCEGFVFAAGVDERVEGPPPIYDLFERYNITPLRRLLRVAKQCGVKRTVICGSYFSYFAKQWPALQLARWHPYIRSRVAQEEMALSFADEAFSVGVLELPYIFGVQPGRRPVWVFLVEMIRGMKHATLYPGGGTTMVTARQVGQAMAGALEQTSGGVCWPIGWYNMTWKEFLAIVHAHMGMPRRKVYTVPRFLYALGSRRIVKEQRAAGHEGGLQMEKFADVMCAETFIDKSQGCLPLGVAEDDMDAAIGASIRLCLDILDGRAEPMVDMKGE